MSTHWLLYDIFLIRKLGPSIYSHQKKPQERVGYTLIKDPFFCQSLPCPRTRQLLFVKGGGCETERKRA